MPVDSRSERGARMKSVGILATSYTLLYRHMQFLENQVRFVAQANFTVCAVQYTDALDLHCRDQSVHITTLQSIELVEIHVSNEMIILITYFLYYFLMIDHK